ncbi:MAG: hypothetical protein GTO26_02970 [Planctomycetales bacterium]|nr:hypothetical protein [Planctomycetales bacterium]NIO33954.1 hypothetical protein [Planctomycetales bacterium]NIO45737.1 hypothetical protein [Planctomycetales bacterium]NIP84587.1 hypothetical protein [Planctomycetales bacterium]
MGQDGRNAVAAIGFLTVVRDQRHGLCGGYLIVNPAGRPLEFHCTAPVRPNRAQEILYGPTLDEFLYGEQIGRTLVQRGGVQPALLCTDALPMMSLRPLISQPLALLLPSVEPQTEESPLRYRVDPGQEGPPEARMLNVRGGRMTTAPAHPSDLATIADLLPGLDELDLAEPFERIRAAIVEAQGS